MEALDHLPDSEVKDALQRLPEDFRLVSTWPTSRAPPNGAAPVLISLTRWAFPDVWNASGGSLATATRYSTAGDSEGTDATEPRQDPLPSTASTCATVLYMTAEATSEHDVVGLRELRQNASDIVRRVQAGDTVTVTVSGRPAARIIPATRRAWIRWNDIAGLFTPDRAADEWTADRDRLDTAGADPWAGR